MAAVTFDTHASIKNLISAGADEKLAEAIVDVLMDGQHSDQIELATKHDFELLRRDLTIRMLLIVGSVVGAAAVVIIGAVFAMLQALGVAG